MEKVEEVEEVEELSWITEDYLDTERPDRDVVGIVGKDSKGKQWVRISQGWFMHDDTGEEWATYWDYWINDSGEVILRLRGAEGIDFPITEKVKNL